MNEGREGSIQWALDFLEVCTMPQGALIELPEHPDEHATILFHKDRHGLCVESSKIVLNRTVSLGPFDQRAALWEQELAQHSGEPFYVHQSAKSYDAFLTKAAQNGWFE